MYSILIWIINLGCFSLATEGSNSQDLTRTSFLVLLFYNDAIVGWDSIWTTKKSVWKYVLKDWIEINIWGSNHWIHKRPSLIISITKFLLRMTMVLAVTMIIIME